MNRLTHRRMLLLAGTLAVATLCLPAAAQDDVYRIGYAVSMTGPNATGVGISTLPNYRLWAHEVNKAGGLKLPNGTRLKIEVIEYDDRSSAEEAVRAVERLAQQDKVDFILPPWGTGFNLAVGPLMHRLGYPQLVATGPTDRASEFATRWRTSYWMLGGGSDYTAALAELLADARVAARINDRVAVISVADGFGIDLIKAARPALTNAGFTLVYDKTYPMGTSDFAALLTEVRHSGADTFIAFSYPPESFALTNQARTIGYNPKVFYIGVGGSYPIFPHAVGHAQDGVMSIGGVDGSSKKILDYFARHKAFIGTNPDSASSSVTYASLEMLAQAIERVGTNRVAIAKELSTGEFGTIIGTIKLENNQLRKLWLAGQWQDGRFVAIAPRDREGAMTPIIPKPAWK